MGNYLRRVERIEELMGPRVECPEPECMKCMLTRTHAYLTGEPWEGCNGFPLSFEEMSVDQLQTGIADLRTLVEQQASTTTAGQAPAV